MSELPDYCAQCGKPLTVIHPNEEVSGGARLRCCEGLGYWSHHAPVPEDNVKLRTEKSPKGVVYYLYKGQMKRWNPGQRRPNEKPKWVK